MSEQHISIEQLFREELEAVLDMAEALHALKPTYDTFDPDYYELQSEIIKLESTAQYLEDRLAQCVPCRFLR